jgi:hypothetical protein
MKHSGFLSFAAIFVLVALTTSAWGRPASLDNFAYIDPADVLMFVSNQGTIGYDKGEVFGYGYGTFYPYTSVGNIENGSQIKSPLFSAGLWLAGKVDRDIRVAVADYLAHHAPYAPGPMANGVCAPDAYTNDVYRVYKLYADSGAANPNADYLEWPTDQGAPVDGSGQPLFMADQTLWAVFNDADTTTHPGVDGLTEPLGIEVHQTVWAANTPGAERMIYVKYKLYNKGSNAITDFHIGFWMDPDIGWKEDDKNGCDTTEDIFYSYNADNDDDVYGAAPPAIGARLVYGPIAPSLGDSAWFDGEWLQDFRNLRLTSAVSYVNGADPTPISPSFSSIVYNCLTGLEPDGSPQSSGTTFCYPGDPVAGTGNLDPFLTDKKIVGAVGPLTFTPGDSQCVLIKLAIGQGSDNLQSVTDLKQILSAPDDVITDVADGSDVLPAGYALSQNYPNPFNPRTTISYTLPQRAQVEIIVFNLLGRHVRTLVDRPESAGPHTVVWNGNDDLGRAQASGVYFYRARLGETTVARKMMLVK